MLSTEPVGVHTLRLISHPSTPSGVVRGIEVQVRRPSGTTLELRYLVDGGIGRLLIPNTQPSRRADRLWRHTCFEAFVAAGSGAGYYELNFSPSTEWAAYRFSAYREGMTAVEPMRSPRISADIDANRLVVAVAIDLEPLSELHAGVGLRIALSAVIEDAEHRIFYWALAHPPGKPDFHHPDGFALLLEAPG
jgi:hypothetical protein